jgi:hypothetical protein
VNPVSVQKLSRRSSLRRKKQIAESSFWFATVIPILRSISRWKLPVPYFSVIAASLTKWQDRLIGVMTGWSSLGVTVAATHSEDTELIRRSLPHALFLVLGYWAQGASAKEAVRRFAEAPPDCYRVASLARRGPFCIQAPLPKTVQFFGRRAYATHWSG